MNDNIPLKRGDLVFPHVADNPNGARQLCLGQPFAPFKIHFVWMKFSPTKGLDHLAYDKVMPYVDPHFRKVVR